MHICVIAGEPSGDFLGGKLIEALKEMRPDVHISGVGGHHMQAAGMESLFNYQQLAVMGVAEVLPKIPALLARINETVNHILETKPDVVVTIDSPDFGFRVAKAVRKKMATPPKLVHYVAPTVWAWREGRAEKVSRFLDGMICLFDFEPLYFERYGLKSVAVGHPMVEGDAMDSSGARFRDEYGIAQRDVIVGALFGSRRGELKRTGPVIRDALVRMAEQSDVMPQVVAPTLPHLYGSVMDLLRDYPGAIHIVTESAHKYDAFRSMNVALAVSGTVGLELAALEVPHVIGYRMSPLTAMMIRRLVKVKYAHLANIMEDREVVPEFIQENCTADHIAASAMQLLQSSEEQKAAFQDVKFRLGFGQEQSPSKKAAAFLLALV
ncbi:MAG: lipid-A-disaccharide synthase [Micavibrio aeruginosavorus]|uniref:Lipid-A-disaccharide synthase n=1 Tax=Micavibrio aeruginosavorus TaxID=349221 RepID=A0A2W4ZQG3_9BACT|nr:MAG: lipid-A-disaccharide synthase [Micavibrio aeruginosavorus]